MSEITIRPATVEDLPAVNDIYNHYVLHSTCTYQTELETTEARRTWFEHHGERHPITVAEEAGQIVGWGSLSRFHPRAAYAQTVENSVYVDHSRHRRGIGRALLADLIERAEKIGHHAIMALIDADQPGSVALHAALGFHQVGYLQQVGFKFGRWLDVVYMERLLQSRS